MAYELFETPVHGKVLAQRGKVVILPKQQAQKLAERFSGTTQKTVTGNYMVKLPKWANDITECDCGGSGMAPDIINFRMGQAPFGNPEHQDHEVQMARSQLYRTAKLAMMVHELLKKVDEQQGLEGWVQSKLTRAADYIETVYGYLDYELTSNQMYTAEAGAGTGVGVAPVQPVGGTTTVPGQTTGNATDGKTKTPGMVKMAKVDMNGKIQGTPIMVPVASIKSKQQAGFRVIGEDASGGSSSAGGIASGGNGFLNGGPGSTMRRRTTEEWETLEPGKPFGLANPRIMQVGDDPQGINDFRVMGNNVLSIYPFDAKNWNNEQMHARSKGYMLKYVGKDPRKAQMANAGAAPQMGRNMRGDKLK